MTSDVFTDPDVVASFLSDAAHVPGGFAAGVAFPRSANEVADLVASASAILPIGAQSSLTGGATPRGETILSTRALTGISIDRERGLAHTGAGVPLRALQTALAGSNLWYPPAPTYDGAFVGGTISTNAAGAATFKYGTTRPWVLGLTVVLAGGDILQLRRGDVVASGHALTLQTARGGIDIAVPRYAMPDVPKLSAGYFAKSGMDLIDLFIGSEGTLGVIVDATLGVIERPQRCVALVPCADDQQALHLTRALRGQAQRAWLGEGTLDVSAIEYMDARSLSFVPDVAFVRAGTPRAAADDALLLVQIEVDRDLDEAIATLVETVSSVGIASDPVVALPGDDAAAVRLFELREAVPMSVNVAVGSARSADPAIQKTAGDFIVPFDRLDESIALYRRACESRGLAYAIWGHVSDGNLHPNVIPRSRAEMDRGQEALLEMARAVIAAGGSPLAEHGVGRSPFKQQLLRELYGEHGIEQMRSVKRALDPGWKLAPGVLFPA